MVRQFVALILASLLFFGCLQTTPPPTAQASPSPTPLPTPSPTPAAVQIIQQARDTVPLSGNFLAELAGVKVKAPDEYTITSEGSFSLSLSLAPLTRLNFHEDDFAESLKHIATSSQFRKTLSVDSTRFEVTWSAIDSQGNVEESVQARLLRQGASSVCVVQKSGQRQCVTPSKDQVEQLWKALQSNALEEGIQLLYPGVKLKEFLKVEKSESVASFAGRPCTSYSLSLTQRGLDELNKLGGNALADMKGSLCLDQQYGFPLFTELKSSLAKALEEVKEFKTKEEPTPKPVVQFKRKRPVYEYNPNSEESLLVLKGKGELDTYLKKCTAEKTEPATLSEGDCIVSRAGRIFFVTRISTEKSSYNQNGPYLQMIWYKPDYRQNGDIKFYLTGNPAEDGFDLGYSPDDTHLYLDVIKVEKGPAGSRATLKLTTAGNGPSEPQFIFKNPASPTVEEIEKAAYANICNTVSEGTQTRGNGNCVQLNNGYRVYFFWYYPANRYEAVGTTFATAYVFPPQSFKLSDRLTLNNPGQVYTFGPFNQGKYTSGIVEKTYPSKIEILVDPVESKELHPEAFLKFAVRSVPLRTENAIQREQDKYFTEYRSHRLCIRFNCKESEKTFVEQELTFETPAEFEEFRARIDRPDPALAFSGITLTINDGIVYTTPSKCANVKQYLPYQPNEPYGTGQLAFGIDKLLTRGKNVVKLTSTVCPFDKGYYCSGSTYSELALCQDIGLFGHKPLPPLTIEKKDGVVVTPTPLPLPTATSTPTPSPTPTPTPTPTPEPLQSGDVALIVANSNTLSTEEKAVQAMLEKYPALKVTLVNTSRSIYDNLKGFNAVVATDYYANKPFNAETINKLAADGKKILLLHDAIGFLANQAPGQTGNTFLRPTSAEAFLSSYSVYRENDNYIGIQSGGNAYQGWMAKSIGSAEGYGGYGTSSGYAINDKGGKWAAWGYDPSKLTDEGKIMAAQVIEWTLGVKPATVFAQQSAVVLLAKDYADVPVLTEKEKALKVLWEQAGYSVQVLPQRQRFNTDYSNVKAITAAEESGFQNPDWYGRLSDEKPLLFVHAALRNFWPINEGEQNRLSTMNGKGFVAKYDEGYENWLDVTTNAKGYARNNWGYGFEQTDSAYGYAGGTFHKKTAKAKSGLIGYDPTRLTGEGKILFRQAIEYVTGEVKKDPVQSGAVVLIAESYDAQPSLNAAEAALKKSLEEHGLTVQVIPQSQRFSADYSNAKAAAVASSPPYSFTLAGFFETMSNERPLLVTHAGSRLFYRLGEGGDITYLKVQRDAQKAFLSKYDPNEEVGIPIITGGKSFTRRTWGFGFNQLDWTGCCYDGAAFYKETPKGKSVIFAYDWSKLTSEGKIMTDEILRWMFNDNAYAQVIPAGQASLLVADYDGAKLTTNETVLKEQLTAAGLTTVIVPQKNRFKTDYSKAALVAMAEKPFPQSLNTYFGSMAATAPRVLLTGVSSNIPQLVGSGKVSSMVVSVAYNHGPLKNYAKETRVSISDTSTPAFGHSTWHFGGIWKAAGQVETCCFGFEYWHANVSNMGTPSNACGILFGYATEQLNSGGRKLLADSIRWLADACYKGVTR